MSQHPAAEQEATPPGEHIHMPESSILPLFNAIGLAGTIVSITLSLTILIPFAILFLVTLVIWIRSAAREVNELPLDASDH